MRRISKTFSIGFVAAALAAVAALAAGSATAAPARHAAKQDGVKLSLVGYSVAREEYKDIIPAFQRTPDGQGVTFDQSFGASGDQARAVVNGLPADVVHLSLEPDVKTLVDAGLVDAGWKKQLPNNGIPTTSVVVFVLRDGNPKKIKSWTDLARKGVQIVTPNPATSGAAKWNILGAYYSQIKAGKKPAEAEAYLKQVAKNIVSFDKSGRDALNTFLSGKGDVLLTYENEAILAQKQKQPVFYIIPRITLRIDTPVAVLKSSKNPAQAKAFAQYLFTPEAQLLAAKSGYRPADKNILATQKFPPRPGLFTIVDKFIGGWSKADPAFFDASNGIFSKIVNSGGIGGGS